METVWFIILGVLLGIYILLDGYEWGGGMVYWLFAGDDKEKMQVLKSIRSIWDANEVWLIAFAALTYFIFPGFFETFYSNLKGIIFVFIFVFVLNILLQNLVYVLFNQPFRKYLDILYGLSNVFIVGILGFLIAMFIRGGITDNMGFWSEKFSPLSSRPGYIDWFTVLFTVFFYILILLQGLGWIVHKASGAFGRKLKFIIKRLAWAGTGIFLLLVAGMYFLHANMYRNFYVYPILFIIPIFILSSLSGLILIRSYQKDNKGFFLATNLFIYFWLGLMIISYPYLLHPTAHHPGISIFETDFHPLKEYHLQWWVIGIALSLLIYSILIHKYYKGKDLLK